MNRTLFWRMYRARPLATLILCLPGLLLLTWYGWEAFSKFDHYRRFVGSQQELTPELAQLLVHDALMSDRRRMTMAPPPEESSLRTFRLILNRNDWNELLDSASIREDRPYVRGKVEDVAAKTTQPARIRLRGGRHWHLAETQKSMKIKMDKGDLIAGSRVANLLNDPTPMVIGEDLIIDLARERGILTPASYFARVKVNSKDLGVYHYEAGADESLLRDAKRVPGSIYNGELSKRVPTEELWQGARRWTKVASRTDSEEDKTSFGELEAFLAHFREDSAREFADFAKFELDLEQFAQMDVLDVAFGGDQHDFRENHKYYLDPYRGRWEPIAWNFRGFHADPHFNLVDNPILLRLKSLPNYLALRDRLLYEFLTREGRPSRIRERALQLLTRLVPELQLDPYWDAYRQLPRVDGFTRRMVRPMTVERLLLVVESELTTYRHRHAQLVADLERNPLYLATGPVERLTPETARSDAQAHESNDQSPQPAESRPNNTAAKPTAVAEPPAAKGEQYALPITVVIDGRVGAALREMNVEFDERCENPEPTLYRAADGTTPTPYVQWLPLETRNVRGNLELDQPEVLFPGVRVVPHERPNPRRGKIRSALAPTEYRFRVVAACRPTGVVAQARHLSTNSRIVSRVWSTEEHGKLNEKHLSIDETPKFEPGERFPHPWDYAHHDKRAITLGPGTVTITETRVFPPEHSVTVEPGTHLVMGPDTSLVFLGSVHFNGRANAPILVDGSEDVDWGGIAIHGEGTSGSRLAHVIVRGGSVPSWRSTAFPALVNIHATSDIKIEDCQFSGHRGETDVIHAAYVDRIDIADTTVSDVGGDAVDLEFSNGELKRLRLFNIGDDGIDTMGSDALINDSLLVGLKGNGISAGEESRLNVRNTVIAEAKVGALTKNASILSLSGSVLFHNGIGVRSYQRTVRYGDDSQLHANVLFVVGSEKHAIKRKDREHDRLDSGRIQQALPQSGTLDHVLENVLGLSDWQQAEAKLTELRGGVQL